jgi:CRP-like cAMP-binding protein
MPQEFCMNMDAAAFVAGPELVDALRQHASPVVCDGDRVLFNQGDAPDGLYIFHNGKVELSMRSGAGDVVMSMPALEDSLLGLPGLIGNMPYSLSALATAGSNVSYLSRDALNRLMLSDSTVSVGILRVLAAEVRTARMALMES